MVEARVRRLRALAWRLHILGGQIKSLFNLGPPNKFARIGYRGSLLFYYAEKAA